MEQLGGRGNLSKPGRERGSGRPSAARGCPDTALALLLRPPRPEPLLALDRRGGVPDELDRRVRRVAFVGPVPDARLRGLDRPRRSGVLGSPPFRREALREPQLQGVRIRAALPRRAGPSLARLRSESARGRG